MPELTAKEMDIFMLVISKFQYESRELVFDGYEFFRALKDPKESYQDLFDSFESFADKILSFNIKYKTQDKAYAFVCFESFKMDFTTNKVRIKAQEDFYNMILNHNLGYTRFELLEFANLSGKYTKTLYRLLKQFRQTGFLKMEWDEFSRIMQIPADYNQSNIDQFILKPAIKELTKPRTLFDQERIPFENLAYIKTKSRERGGKVIGIELSFTPQKKEELELKEQQALQAESTNTTALKKQPNLNAYYGLSVSIPTRTSEGLHKQVEGKISSIYEVENGFLMNVTDENRNTKTLPFENIEALEKCVNTYQI